MMGRPFRFPSISKDNALIMSDAYRDEGEMSPYPFRTAEDEGQELLSTATLIALTCSTGGLQVVWSLIMSNGTVWVLASRLSKFCADTGSLSSSPSAFPNLRLLWSG